MGHNRPKATAITGNSRLQNLTIMSSNPRAARGRLQRMVMPPFKITSASVSVCHASNFCANMVQIQFIAVHFSSILFIARTNMLKHLGGHLCYSLAIFPLNSIYVWCSDGASIREVRVVCIPRLGATMVGGWPHTSIQSGWIS